jgi:hypothetical protein
MHISKNASFLGSIFTKYQVQTLNQLRFILIKQPCIIHYGNSINPYAYNGKLRFLYRKWLIIYMHLFLIAILYYF